MEITQKALERAVTQYLELVDHRISGDPGDVRHPITRELYRKFATTKYNVELGANDGEWIALRAGLKPLIREIVPADVWNSKRPVYEAEGFSVVSYPLPVAEDWIDGFTFDSAAKAHREHQIQQGDHKPEDQYMFRVAKNGSDTQRVLTYVGHDAHRIKEALELDKRLMAYTHTDVETALIGQLGRLLGYPDCCVEAYTEVDRIHRNEPIIRRSAAASTGFHPLLNNLSLSFFHYIGWFPCRYDCPSALAYATRVDAELQRNNATVRPMLLKVLSLTRLYWDDRRQLLFENDDQPHHNGYTNFVTPFALDRSPQSAYFDWVFFYDVGQTLSRGNRWEVDGGRCLIYNDEHYVGDIGRAPVVLPFGQKKSETLESS